MLERWSREEEGGRSNGAVAGFAKVDALPACKLKLDAQENLPALESRSADHMIGSTPTAQSGDAL